MWVASQIELRLRSSYKFLLFLIINSKSYNYKTEKKQIKIVGVLLPQVFNCYIIYFDRDVEERAGVQVNSMMDKSGIRHQIEVCHFTGRSSYGILIKNCNGNFFLSYKHKI